LKILIKIGKIILFGIIGIVSLNVLLYLLLLIPAVQQSVLQFALNRIKPIVKTEISIDRIQVSLFNHASLEGVYVEDRSGDTLLYAKEMSVTIDTWKLFKNNLVIKGVSLDDFLLNISRKDPRSPFNYEFLTEAFASEDTVKKESVKPMSISIEDIDIRKGRLHFDTKSEPQTPGIFNPSHVTLSELQAKLSLPSVETAKFDIHLKHLSFKELSGTDVRNIKFRLKNRRTTWRLEDVEIELAASKIDIPLAEYDLLNKKVNVRVNNSRLFPDDLARFLPQTKSLKEEIRINGSVRGKLPLVSVDSLHATYGKDLELIASGQISNYGDYRNAKLGLSINTFRTTQKALKEWIRVGNPGFSFPSNIVALGNIRLKGVLAGDLADMNLSSDIWTRQGAISMKGKISTDTTFSRLAVKGKIQTQNFNIQPFAGPDFGRLSAQADIQFSQISPSKISLKTYGMVHFVQYGKENFQGIRFVANYSPTQINGLVDANMRQGKVYAKLKMQQGKNSLYEIDGKIENLHINSFFTYEKWNNPYLSVGFAGKASGNFEKGFEGKTRLENLNLIDGDARLAPGDILLEGGKTSNQQNFIQLASSFLDARMDGVFNFTTLPDEMATIIHRYLPQFIQQQKTRLQGKNIFQFSAATKDTREIEKIFNLPFNLTEPLILNGAINTNTKKIDIRVKAPRLKYQQGEVKESEFALFNENNQMNFGIHSRYFHQNSRMEFDLNANADSDTIRSQINLSHTSPDLEVGGQIDSYAFFGRDAKNQLVSHLNIEPSMIYVNELRFLLNPASMVNQSGKTTISDLGMRVNGKKYIEIGGVISDNPSDTLHVDFTQAKLADLLTAFSINHVEALLDGSVSIASATRSPQVFTDQFQIRDIVLYGDSLGSIDLSSRWSDQSQAVDLNAQWIREKAHLADMAGLVYTGDTLRADLDFKLDKLPVDWVQPFVSDYLNTLKGELSSNLKIQGSLTNPDVEGWLGIHNGEFGLSYTNVVYKISDTIRLSKNKVGFDNLQIDDPLGNKAYLSADIKHDKFGKIEYLLNARMNNFMALNTESQTDSLFYGKMFVSGTTTIKGNDSRMDILLNVSNAKNSAISVLLPQRAEAVEYKGIVYVNTPPPPVTESGARPSLGKQKTEPFAIRLASNLGVSNDLSLSIFFDSNSGNWMQVAGNGLMDFTYDNSTGDMRAFGNYTITKGSVKMNLQRISNMEFTVKEGSKLTFRGDPMLTSFDITAYKDVKADLLSLDESFSSDATLSSTRIPVRCVLGIKGDINQMNLTYSVELPEARDEIQQKVKALIATDEQRIQQFVYLLFANSFYNSSASNLNQGFGVNSMVTSVASGALNKTLDAMFGKILGDKWNIDTDLSSRDGSMENMDVNVNLSTKLLNDRLRIRTNVGYRTGGGVAATQETNLVGNIDVEYLLNKSFKLKVYSKENDQYYRQASTTQGLGIVYTREAKRLKDVFGFFRKKKKKEIENNP
jgi:hypothetical protein